MKKWMLPPSGTAFEKSCVPFAECRAECAALFFYTNVPRTMTAQFLTHEAEIAQLAKRNRNAALRVYDRIREWSAR